MPSVLFLFLKTALVTQVLSWFHTNFRVVFFFPISVKTVMAVETRDPLYAIGRNVSWHSSTEGSTEVSQKFNMRTTI